MTDATPDTFRVTTFARATAAMTGIISFFVFLMTMTPSLHFGDGTELATAAWTAGIAHPTGYPLYTMILWAIMHICPLEPISLSTIFSALCVAIATAITTRIFTDVFNNIAKPLHHAIPTFAAAAVALTIAFSPAIWHAATVTEVYAMQLLISIGFIRALQLTIANNTNAAPIRRIMWPLLIAALLFGTGMAHHRMSVFLFLPLIVTAVIIIKKQPRRRAVSLTGALCLAMLLPLCSYLYLPIRAAQAPAMNWGQPDTIQRFTDHIRGGDYMNQRFLALAPGISFTPQTYAAFAATMLQRFSGDIAEQTPLKVLPTKMNAQPNPDRITTPKTSTNTFAAIMLIAAFIGGIIVLTRTGECNRIMAIIIGLILAQNILFLFLYNIPDISDYELLPIWGIMGGAFVLLYAIIPTNRHRALPAALTLVLFAIAGAQFCMQYHLCDKSGDISFEQSAYTMMPDDKTDLPDGAIFITAGDADIFPAWYRQLVRGERTDVLVFGSNFVHRPWYAAYFTPEQKSKYGLKFFDTIPRGPDAFAAMLSESIIDANIGKRPIVTTIADKLVLDALSKKYQIKQTAYCPFVWSIEPIN
ncbi:MAG: DUF2723 domain-containing protein [Candidatus Sumerlaeales bacterium]|nr:DUF2723 domain-containing protein [Candidatus Sumerlaeales bacterium]